MKTAACLLAALLSAAAGPARAGRIVRPEARFRDPEARAAALVQQVSAAIRALELQPDGSPAREDPLVQKLRGAIQSLELQDQEDAPGGDAQDESLPVEPLEAVAASLLRSGPDSTMGQLKALVDSLQRSILLDHNRSQEMASQMVGHFSVCKSDASWAGFKNTYDTKLPLHAECRAAERQLNITYTACANEKAALCGVKEAECNAFEEEKNKPNDPTGECAVNAMPREAWLGHIAQRFAGLNATFQLKKKKCEDAKGPCNYKVCDLSGLQSKRQECNTLLGDVQAAACGWATAKKVSCNNFDGCWKSATETYANLKATHESEQKQRKLSWRITERLKCLIAADGKTDKNAEIEKCTIAPKPDTSHLNITFPNLPPNPGCQDPVLFPCNGPYLAAIKVSGMDLPDCNTCPMPSPPGPPGPPVPLGDSFAAGGAFHLIDTQGYKVWGNCGGAGVEPAKCPDHPGRILTPTLLQSVMTGSFPADDPPAKVFTTRYGNFWLSQSGKVWSTGTTGIWNEPGAGKGEYLPTELFPSFFANKPPVIKFAGNEDNNIMVFVLKDGSVYWAGSLLGGWVTTPEKVLMPPAVDVKSSASRHIAVLTRAGEVWGIARDRAPWKIEGLPAGDPAKLVVHMQSHAWARTQSGRWYSWGFNEWGQLGRDTGGQIGSAAGLVTTLPSDEKPVQVAGGDRATFVLTESGKILSVGVNSHGRLGDGTTTHRRTWTYVKNLPADDPVVWAGADEYQSFANTKSGKFFSWGYGQGKGVGDGTRQDRHLPVLIPEVAFPAV